MKLNASSESESLCVTALILCWKWLERNAPDAMVVVDMQDGVVRPTMLVGACDAALAAFRAEHGDRP